MSRAEEQYLCHLRCGMGRLLAWTYMPAELRHTSPSGEILTIA
jgi:hypothetical protein